MEAWDPRETSRQALWSWTLSRIRIVHTDDQAITMARDMQSKGVKILREPHDAGFGLTFLAADPDGNRIRVAPQD
ncbi:hypothetical protein GCM10010244_32380 [Streptomyces coeruleorubidus]|nr:hypothetical protein GCM10010244_32380 [Streptomyces bellus]